MIRVEINTLTADRTPVPQGLQGLDEDTLRNLQTDLNPVPSQHIGFEWWLENITLPTFNADTHKQGSEILTVDEPAKTVDVTYNVDALDAGELADVLAARKPPKLKLLRTEGLRRIQIAMPAITDWDALDLVREQFLSIAPAARQPTANLQSLIDIYQAGKTAVTDINAMTDVAVIDDYDVTTDPSWP